MSRRTLRTLGALAAMVALTLWLWYSNQLGPKRLGGPEVAAQVPQVVAQIVPKTIHPSTNPAPSPSQPPPSTLECFAPKTWTIDNKFAASFALSDAEVSAVNTALANTIAELNELELKHLVIEYESPETSFFRIEPFASEGEALKNKAFSALDEALPDKGTAATAVRQALSQRGLMNRSDFGGRATEFKVTALAPPTNNRFAYEVYQREFLGPTPVFETRDPRMPAGSIVSETVESFSEVPQRLKHLLDGRTLGNQ